MSGSTVGSCGDGHGMLCRFTPSVPDTSGHPWLWKPDTRAKTGPRLLRLGAVSGGVRRFWGHKVGLHMPGGDDWILIASMLPREQWVLISAAACSLVARPRVCWPRRVSALSAPEHERRRERSAAAARSVPSVSRVAARRYPIARPAAGPARSVWAASVATRRTAARATARAAAPLVSAHHSRCAPLRPTILPAAVSVRSVLAGSVSIARTIVPAMGMVAAWRASAILGHRVPVRP